jgi:hypothetical protein
MAMFDEPDDGELLDDADLEGDADEIALGTDPLLDGDGEAALEDEAEDPDAPTLPLASSGPSAHARRLTDAPLDDEDEQLKAAILAGFEEEA